MGGLSQRPSCLHVLIGHFEVLPFAPHTHKDTFLRLNDVSFFKCGWFYEVLLLFFFHAQLFVCIHYTVVQRKG